MKRLTLIMALVLSFTMGAIAQPKQLSEEHKERIFNAKAQIMQSKLELTEGQMKDFLAVYKQYQDEIMKIKRPKRVAKSSELTKDAAYEAVVGQLDFKKKILDVQEKYIGKLKPILTPMQLVKFLKVENYVQMSIRNHKDGRKAHLDSTKRTMRENAKMAHKGVHEGCKASGSERVLPREPKKELYNK